MRRVIAYLTWPHCDTVHTCDIMCTTFPWYFLVSRCTAKPRRRCLDATQQFTALLIVLRWPCSSGSNKEEVPWERGAQRRRSFFRQSWQCNARVKRSTLRGLCGGRALCASFLSFSSQPTLNYMRGRKEARVRRCRSWEVSRSLEIGCYGHASGDGRTRCRQDKQEVPLQEM